MAVLFLLASGGARALGGRLSSSVPLPWRGLSVTVGFLLAVMAWHVYISRFELLFEHHTIFDGISYTDAHITIGGLLLVCAALVIGAAIAIGTCLGEPARALAGDGDCPGGDLLHRSWRLPGGM